MALSPDEIELAQQIADALEEGIEALSPVFFGSTYTKSDCCKHLIKPLREKYNIEILLEPSPHNDAKLLRERYDRLMSCFDPAGELLNQNLSLATVKRYVNDLIEALRDIARGIKQDTAAVKQDEKDPLRKEPKPIEKRFTFRPGQILFDDRDLNVGTGAILDIAKALVENFDHVVPFQDFDENSSEKEASEKIRTAIVRLRKALESARIPVVIGSRKAEGYIMLPSTR